MKTLKNSTIQKIKDTVLKSKYFTLDDFEFQFSDTERSLLNILFIPYPQYEFTIREIKVKKEKQINTAISLYETSYYEEEEKLQVIMSPGEYKNIQKSICDKLDIAINQISQWLYYIHIELENINKEVDITNTISDIKAKFEKQFPDKNEVFLAEEIEELKAQLENIKQKIIDLEKSSQITQEEKEEFEVVIQQSSDNLLKYPKRTWYFTTWNKFKNLNTNIKLLLEFEGSILKVIEHFL